MTRITLDLSHTQADRLRQELGIIAAAGVSNHSDETNTLNEITQTLSNLVERVDVQLAESGGKFGQTAEQLKTCKEQHQILTLLGALITNANSIRGSLQESGAEIKRVHSALEEVRQELSEAKSLLAADPATGLPNVRAFVPMVNDAILCVSGSENRLSIAVLMILGMDKLGDDQMPQAIEHVIALLKSTLRREDALVRAQGSEFAIMFPQSEIRGAHFVLQRVKQLLAKSPWRHGNDAHTFGIRAGLAQLKQGETGPTLIGRARAMLKQTDEGIGVAE